MRYHELNNTPDLLEAGDNDAPGLKATWLSRERCCQGFAHD